MDLRPDHRWLRAFGPVFVALILGVAVGAVPGQVQDAKQRELLTTAAQAEEQLVAMRLDLARTALEEARRKFEVGLLTRTSLVAAESALRGMESRLAKIRLDTEEIQATSRAPRDEISAPLVGSRDFVTERLRGDLRAAEQRLSLAEAATLEARRRYEVGTASPLALREAETDVTRAKSDLQRLAAKLALRKQFVAGGVEVADVERRMQRLELQHDADIAETLLKLAQDRLANLQKKYEIGTADQIELKRAELDVLERRAELASIGKRLKMLEAAK